MHQLHCQLFTHYTLMSRNFKKKTNLGFAIIAHVICCLDGTDIKIRFFLHGKSHETSQTSCMYKTDKIKEKQQVGSKFQIFGYAFLWGLLLTLNVGHVM